MRVTAAILALSSIRGGSAALWDADLGGPSVLECVAAALSASGLAEEAAVVTDSPELLARGQCLGLPVRPCPENMLGHPFNFLAVESYRVCQEAGFLRQTGLEGDIVFFLPWNLPLISAHTLERLYHALLEDPLAGRMLPMAPVDPQLYTRLPGEDAFFPVWAHKGMDRQRIPQLYRSRNLCVAHMGRLQRTLPRVKGLSVSRLELIEAAGPEEAGLLRHVLQARRAGERA